METLRKHFPLFTIAIIVSITAVSLAEEKALPEKASGLLIQNIETANVSLGFFAGNKEKRQVRQAQTDAKIGVVELVGGKPTRVEIMQNFGNTFAGNNHLVQGKRVNIRLNDGGAKLTGDLSFIPTDVFEQIPGSQGKNPEEASLEVTIDKKSQTVNYQVE